MLFKWWQNMAKIHCASVWEEMTYLFNNMTTVILKFFRAPIFMDSFNYQWPGLKDFFQFFEMEELVASEAQKTEILD